MLNKNDILTNTKTNAQVYKILKKYNFFLMYKCTKRLWSYNFQKYFLITNLKHVSLNWLTKLSHILYFKHRNLIYIKLRSWKRLSQSKNNLSSHNVLYYTEEYKTNYIYEFKYETQKQKQKSTNPSRHQVNMYWKSTHRVRERTVYLTECRVVTVSNDENLWFFNSSETIINCVNFIE